ncbi:MAG TPA: metallophosphoesterase family protein, partial [Solirubrobacteraceae bacterium]|nr:metallophosphoesterase family protein [Solirubrobacteraceae bacterium]
LGPIARNGMIAPMIACLYDVHGNLPALDAVLADAREAGASGYLVGGDVALFGAYPAETVARLRALPNARWLRGNGERWTAAPQEAPDDATVQSAIAAARAALGIELVMELGHLPESVGLGSDTRAWHGSPAGDVLSFLPEPAPSDAELLAGVTERRLIFGHTHLPFRRRHGDIELVNPGSVGMPLDGDRRAAYALLHPDGTVEHRRVDYPLEDVLATLRGRSDEEWTGEVAGRLERAAF